MIQYLLKKDKGGINDGEDKKTSLIFEPLSYLPSDILWRIIRNACADNDTMPNNVGELSDVLFWPSQSSKDNVGVQNTTNSLRVEPDVLFIFEKFTLIIEAKKNDVQNYIQDKVQWNNELISYRNEGHHEPVIMLAIGGNKNMEHYSKGELCIFKCSWTSFLSSICDVRDSLKKDVENFYPTRRILNDIELIFSFYNEYKIQYWAKDIASHNLSDLSEINLQLWKI